MAPTRQSCSSSLRRPRSRPPAAPGALGLEAPGSFKDPNRNLTTVDFNRTSYLAITYDDGGRKLNMYVYTAGIDLDSGVAHPLSDVAVSA